MLKFEFSTKQLPEIALRQHWTLSDAYRDDAVNYRQIYLLSSFIRVIFQRRVADFDLVIRQPKVFLICLMRKRSKLQSALKGMKNSPSEDGAKLSLLLLKRF